MSEIDGVLLIEITPKTPADRIIRLASEPYNHPTAPGHFYDAIMQGSTLRREIFADGLAFGAASDDFGSLEVANTSGWLDWLDEEGVDCYGGSIVMSVLPSFSSPYGDRQIMFTGRAGIPQVNDSVQFQILDDFSLLLAKQIGQQKFLGNNVLPDGVEGVADLKDQYLPVLYGTAYNFGPPCCNTSKLIYCIADRGVAAIIVDAVDDKGADLTRGTQRASVADVLANEPAAGKWDYYLGDANTPAYIRLGSSPAGQVTVTARSGGTLADRTAGQIWRRILIERGGVDPAKISDADVTALDAAVAAMDPADLGEIGFWIDMSGATIQDRLDFIAGTVGAGYWLDCLGVWRTARVSPASGDPAVSFRELSLDNPGKVNELDIIDISPVFTSATDGGRPYDSCRLRYQQNFTVQSKDSLAGIALDKAARLSVQWLESAYPPSTTSPENEQAWDTAFYNQASADAEAQRRYGIFGVLRRRYEITSILTAAVASILDLGKTVLAQHPRYGFAAGRLCLATALEIDLLARTVKTTVWR